VSESDQDGWRVLGGGTMSAVELRGAVVRRSPGRWSSSVRALLRHLEAAGFDPAPRFLGVDEQGRELLSYLPGEVPEPRGWAGDDDALRAAAQLLRRYHDAVRSFRPPGGAQWDPFFQGSGGADIICHNDFGVYNCVFADGRPWGMIDFDGAAPGTCRWDLAWTAISFMPLNPYLEIPDAPRRLRLACDAYGLADRDGFVGVIEARLAHLRDQIVAAAGTDAPQASTPPGFAGYCNRTLELVRGLRPQLEAALR
jgi:Phosphotransferase enzyme family